MNASILDHLSISERYFFPRHEPLENPFWVDCGDARLSCFFKHNHPDGKTIVFFHGNGEIAADYLDFFVPAFDQMGVNLFIAEYRGYGMSTGVPALKTMLDDVETIIRTINIPVEKLVLFGRSVGSFYALHGVRLFPDIPGLILESSVAVVLERLLMRVRPDELGVTLEQMEEAVNRDFNHQAKLAGFKGSTLVLHALHDSLVHVAHGKKLFEWAPEPKRLKIFEQGDHNDIMAVNAREYFQQIYDLLCQV
jgi:alpha-beta hydrolase superfamily lysophospholipase